MTQRGVDVSTVAQDWDALVQAAQTAERDGFDYILLKESVRLDGSAAGVDAFTTLAALSGVTDRIGLVVAIDLEGHEPFEVARHLATLDQLSDGRAGWCLDDDSERAREFTEVLGKLWDSWDPDAVRADTGTGVYADPAKIHAVEHRGGHFEVRGPATLPARPQGHPMRVRAPRLH